MGSPNDCRALAPLCSFLPEASGHSIRLILCEQVSQCSQMFKMSHLTWQREIFLNPTWDQKSWQGKAAQQPHLVLCTNYGQCPSRSTHCASTAQTDFALSLSLLPSAPWQSWKDQDRRGDDLCNTTTAFATRYTSTGCSGKQPHILVRELAILIWVIQTSQFPIPLPLPQIAGHFYKFASAFITLLLSLFAYVVD